MGKGEKIMKIIATTTFGLEAVLKRELIALGYDVTTENGRCIVEGDLRDIAKLNLNLRCADRVLIELLNFKATTFEDLYQGVLKFPWHEYISIDGNFIVQGRSKNSKLFSVSDCQRITERAIIDVMKKHYDIDYFEKSKERYKLEVALRDDIASVTLDTSGDGLHKRGYRARNYKAPLSETIAAALVMLSYWNPDRILHDPFCGSGTILIEAAMIGKNIAPGLMRKFDFEKFKFFDEEIMKEEKKLAYERIDYDKTLKIYGSDIERGAIEIAKDNAELLGLEEDITFFEKDIRDLIIGDDYGVIITNPPYGIRIGKDVKELEKELGLLHKSCPTWSVYAISGDEDFEKNFGKKADRNRKLYNGGIKTYYYQYLGPKPRG